MAGMSEAAWEQLVMDELAELAWEPKRRQADRAGVGRAGVVE